MRNIIQTLIFVIIISIPVSVHATVKFELDSTAYTVNGNQWELSIAPFFDDLIRQPLIPIYVLIDMLDYEIIETQDSIYLDDISVPYFKRLDNQLFIPLSVFNELRIPTRFSGKLVTLYIPEIPSYNTFERLLFYYTNVERRNHDLNELVWDNSLALSARNHADEMRVRQVMQHEGFERNPSNIYDRAKRAGASFYVVGENILWGLHGLSAHDVIRIWMESPDHRDNLLNPVWTHIGISQDTYGKDYPENRGFVVQNFGG